MGNDDAMFSRFLFAGSLAASSYEKTNDLFLEDSTRNDFEGFQIDFPTEHIFCQCRMNGTLLTGS